MANDVDWVPIHMIANDLYTLSGEVCIQILCPFCNWVTALLLSFKSYFYVLDISLLPDMIGIIFSHSVGFLSLS